MLGVRISEQGELKEVTGNEPWSYSVEPGRGIRPSLAKERLDKVQRWPENVPPVPDWSVLDGECFRLDDLPKDYENDENPCVLEIAALDLELTEEQKNMLRPPEDRIKELQFPHDLQNRVRQRKKRTERRKNKWASKFQGLFLGKLSRKWSKKRGEPGGLAELAEESRGVAKAKLSSRPPKQKISFAERFKSKLQKKT